MSTDRSRVEDLIEKLTGDRPSPSGDRAAAVILAQVNALAWARDTIGCYPVPAPIASALQRAADELRADDRDPVDVLTRVALEAVATHRATALV